MPLIHVLASLACLLPGIAAAMPDPQSPCATAARAAADVTGVPYAVLIAIAQTETGRNAQDQTATWPWAVNDQGESHYFATQAQAVAHVEAALYAGRRSFDLGCFQLNFRWHGAAFSSLDEMLDPDSNALHAARFLADLYAESGDWSVAAGAYHSRSTELATAYRTRFDRFLALASAEPDIAPVRPAGNTFPLFQPGGGIGALGSLVPLDL